MVPSTWTADFRPGISQPLIALPAVLVRLGQQQVPGRVQGVDLQLGIEMAIAVGIEEDLEVVVVKDHRIVLGQGAQTCVSSSWAPM